MGMLRNKAMSDVLKTPKISNSNRIKRMHDLKQKASVYNSLLCPLYQTSATMSAEQPIDTLDHDSEEKMNPSDYVASLTSDQEVAAYYSSSKPKNKEKIQERVVQIRRVTKVVKGGKQLSFRAVVAIGDGAGRVSVGVASAKEVIGAVTKAVTDAKKNIVNVPLTRTKSIPHRIESSV